MNRKVYQHLAGRVFGEPLLIRPRKLGVILGVLGPRIGLMPGLPAAFMDDEGDDDDQVNPDDDEPYIVTPEGVAVISVCGALVRKSSWMDSLSGLESYASIEERFLQAVQDDSVRGIILDMDSNGGECGGCFDLADQIYGQRGTKPIYAVANESMYSAAYALGSSADKIFIPRTGGLGSIGVIYLHTDQSEYDAKEGLKYTALFAGARKNDFSPHEPLSKDAFETEMAEIDRLYTIFAQTVARNRGISVKSIKDTQAGLFHGDRAVEAGLADSVGTMADAMGALLGALPSPKTSIVRPIFSAVAAESSVPEVEATAPTLAPNLDPDLTGVIKHIDGLVATLSTAEASATANPNQGEIMPETTKPADTTPDPVNKQFKPKPYGAAHALETMHLCALNGKGLATAISFVEKQTKLKDVRRTLSASALKKNEENETTSAVMPASSASSGTEPKAPMTMSEYVKKTAASKGVN